MTTGWGPSDTTGITDLEGGVTAPAGFVAAGIVSGVKESGRPDLAMVATDSAAAAVMTTSNRVKAPACTLSERHAANGRARAVIINSGNANVCTPEGEVHAERIASAAASALRTEVDDVLVMSTGVIGVPLPVTKIEAALPALVADLTDDGGGRAATAMMTTDTRDKQVAIQVTDRNGRQCVVGAMAKGVGMIEPSMATMLAVITSDAQIDGAALSPLLREAVDATFNRISVDGDQSTSDTVAVLANGAAGPIDEEVLARALHLVCARLAWMIVADGEGATRVAAITVSSAATSVAAERCARSIATSLLVRAAIHGADPNWGRILMALGNSGVDIAVDRIAVTCAGTLVCKDGVAVEFDRDKVAQQMTSDEVEIVVDLGLGGHDVTVLTCDLTPEYVRFNSEYTT